MKMIAFWLTRLSFCLTLFLLLTACAVAQQPETKVTPTPSPEKVVVQRGDIVDRADQMCKKEGNCRLALILYTQAIKERGVSADLFKSRGMAYYALKEVDLAIADFSKAIELQKDSENKDAALFFIRGLSRSMLEVEDRPGACSDFRTARTLGYDLDEDPSFSKWLLGYCPKVISK